eukprot:TRINITY_DN50303_c0_g1_i1.p1 TRINITY_DN50303_c0_g1~~TRINITY_DN50303_c0_g1_i1.p1  ORF type:complete len:493 (+),score=159.17 TRINITY_DN50303_c0_g1_i1:97-1575(+)
MDLAAIFGYLAGSYTSAVLAALAVLSLWSVIRFNLIPAGPNAPPVVGSLVPWLGNMVPFAINPLLYLRRQRERFGHVYTLKLLGNRVTVLAHPECHEAFFMSKNAILSPREVYTFMTPIFGKGVCYDAPYDRMREQFQHISAQLGQKNFERYVPIIQQEVRKFMDTTMGEEGRMNLLDSVGALLVKTSTTCLMGADVAERLPPQQMTQILRDVEAGINPVQVFFPHFTLPMPGIFAMKRSLAKWDATVRQIIQQRVAAEDFDGSDILSGLLRATYRDGSAMSDYERVGILFGTMFAGQHTSVNVACYTLLYLCAEQNRKLLGRHRDEVKAVAEDGELDYDRVQQLVFTHACVKESLRMHPPLIMLMRKVLQPLQVSGRTVPVGDIVAVSTWLSHRTEEVYKHADEWDPARFCDRGEGGGFNLSLDFVGFGGGAHRCLGAKFGSLQNQIAVAMLLQEYDMELECGEVSEPDLTNMVVGPLHNKAWVRYKRRVQ